MAKSAVGNKGKSLVTTEKPLSKLLFCKIYSGEYICSVSCLIGQQPVPSLPAKHVVSMATVPRIP